MLNASARAHHLYIAGHGAAFIALAVFMADGPAAHIGNDFHILMTMRGETALRLDNVVIDGT